MANNTFGMLGSFVYLGQVIGSMMATCFLQTRNTKLVLCSCIILNIIFLVTFTFTRRPSVMMAFRCLTGFFQVFMWVYFPVWADFFGNEEQKSSWLSILIVSSPLGNILGYVLAASIQDGLGWRWCFYIQAIMMLPTAVAIVIIPGKYMDLQKTGKLIRDFQIEKETKERLQSIDSKQPKFDQERLQQHL
jgi:MFS family permease